MIEPGDVLVDCTGSNSLLETTWRRAPATGWRSRARTLWRSRWSTRW